jgi:hypothetical protein
MGAASAAGARPLITEDEAGGARTAEEARITLPSSGALQAAAGGPAAAAAARALAPAPSEAGTPIAPTPTATRIAATGAAVPNLTTDAGPGDYVLTPRPGETGWWSNAPGQVGEVGDSFLYAGRQGDGEFLSAVRFDLARVPRGAPLLAGELQLSGLSDDRLNAGEGTLFRVQLIAERELASFDGADFMTIFSAPASITSLRDLPASELSAGSTNRWTLDANILRWLEQERINGAESVTLRIGMAGTPSGDTLFAWDSGAGQKSEGQPPTLLLTADAPPPTPPALPTRDYLVATFTPVPANVMTAVAQQQTATAVAQTVGTYTPVPAFVTPTPRPENLATLQANALAQGLPAVVANTPVPASDAEAAEQIARATAVAVTTGTYTPVPADYVTPFVVFPSPPAMNTATAIARQVEAEMAAASQVETPTPLPWNAIVGEYVLATPTPANVATAAVVALAATADAQLYGPATATPFHWLVITATPVPIPTATPTLKPVIFESEFTPTPIPTATEFIPAAIPDEYKGLIFFKRGMGDGAQTWVVNPSTGESGLVTRDWLYPMAQKQLTVSPDGRQVVFVRTSNEGTPEIFVRNAESGRETKITNFQAPSYDPAWSPTGEWIAFVSSNDGDDEVYRITPDGAVVEQLTFNDWEWDKHPSWSPDGSQITFFSNRETGNTQIWVMNADGSGQRRVSNSDKDDLYPVWAR